MSKKKKLKNEKIVVIAGTYDPIDKDDLKLLKKAKKNYEWLIVGLHSDNFLIEYHGGYTLDYETRADIIRELRCVDEVMKFKDSDGSACNLLQTIKVVYPGAEIFYITDGVANRNLPEAAIEGITFIKSA